MRKDLYLTSNVSFINFEKVDVDSATESMFSRVAAVQPAFNLESKIMESTRLTKLPIRVASLFASSILSLFFASSSAHAQEPSALDASSPMSQDLVLSDPTISDDPLMEEVFITGSLLPKGNYESNAPITTINAEQFEVSNAINIEQLLTLFRRY